MKRESNFGCVCVAFIVFAIFLSFVVFVVTSTPQQPKPAQAPVATPVQETPRKKGGRCFKHKFKLIKPVFCVFCD